MDLYQPAFLQAIAGTCCSNSNFNKPLLLALSSVHKWTNTLIYLVELLALVATPASNFHYTLHLLQLYCTSAGNVSRMYFICFSTLVVCKKKKKKKKCGWTEKYLFGPSEQYWTSLCLKWHNPEQTMLKLVMCFYFEHFRSLILKDKVVILGVWRTHNGVTMTNLLQTGFSTCVCTDQKQ